MDRRRLPNEDLTPRALHDAFPHGEFSLGARDLDGRKVMIVICRCGRKLEMLDSLPSSILVYWLVDHNDDMFLTEDERDRKHSEQLPMALRASGLPGMLSSEEVAKRFAEVNDRPQHMGRA